MVVAARWINVRTIGSALVALFLLFAICASSATPADAARKKSPTLRILTESQAQLLKSGALRIRVRSKAPGRIRARVIHAGSARYFRPVSKKLSNRTRRLLRLKLRPAGRRELATCGTKKVRVKLALKTGSRTFRVS